MVKILVTNFEFSYRQIILDRVGIDIGGVVGFEYSAIAIVMQIGA